MMKPLAALAALLVALPAPAQVVETPQPFDSLGRVTRLTPAAADSLGLRPPLWPVSGAFASARLYRQSSGGYVLVVERADGAVERIALLDESVAALRRTVGRALESSTAAAAPVAAPAAAAPAVAAGPTLPAAQRPPDPPLGLQAPGGVTRPLTNAAPVGEVMGSQILLGVALYGPLASAAVNSVTGDPTVPYLTYLAALGGSVVVANRLAESGRVTRAQNMLATHMAVHGAAAGAALTYAAGGNSEINGGGYALAALAGGLGGSAVGMLAGRSLDQSEAAASLFTSDLALLDGYLLLSARSDVDRDVDITRGQAASLVLATAAGYALGPLYARAGGRYLTSGDAAVLGTGAGVGMLLSTAIIGDDASRRTDSYGLLVGANVGAVATDILLTRRFDYTPRQGGLMALAAAAGALATLRIPGVADDPDRDTNDDGVTEDIGNEHRVLGFMTAGSLLGMWLMHRGLNVSADRGHPTRVGSAAEPAPGRATGRHGLALTGLSVAPDAANPGRVRLLARLAF